MKKNYIIPRAKLICVNSESLMMQTSETEIGGNTDHFDAKPYNHPSFEDEFEEDDFEYIDE